jgi:hypothetical protein
MGLRNESELGIYVIGEKRNDLSVSYQHEYQRQVGANNPGMIGGNNEKVLLQADA